MPGPNLGSRSAAELGAELDSLKAKTVEAKLWLTAESGGKTHYYHTETWEMFWDKPNVTAEVQPSPEHDAASVSSGPPPWAP